ncbi:MAG TPA: hypothetical protein EYQ42_09390 [Thiotrichaceae bacterium]|jgi:hypothetical protein|nr:hypothetical protein [Thiotrichaceae bacterium]HIM08837.1 hypothetical protein [Gammaproteobacteria bacterium]
MISLQKSKSEFFNRRALFISAEKMSIYHWEKGQLASSYIFDTDDAGRNNFIRYLQETENSPVTILLDVIEEEFRQDTIPHVFGADRLSLIKRKQGRLFRDSNYVHVRSQGREEEGRRDDRLLFVALTKNDIIKPWVELLEKYKVPLKGILSVPLLLESYIKSLPDISEHALLVTMQSISGLRQTFFQNNELKISRLSKLPRYGTQSYAPRIDSEVEKIQRYLDSLRLIPHDASLDIYIVADKATLKELKERNTSMQMVRHHYFDVDQLFGSSGIEKNQEIPFCDQLLIHHLLGKMPKNCYASSREMRYSKMRNMRHALNIASAALLVFGFIFSAFYFMGGLTYKQESEASKNKADFYQVRYELARGRLPKTPVEPAQIKVAVDAVVTLNEYKSTPYEMLSFIGKGLEKFPSIKLDDLDWSASLDPNKGTASSSEDDNNPLLNNLLDEDNETKYYQISNLKAHIEPFNGNYREAIAIVNKFAEALRSFDSSYSISIESFPLDISSTATLEGNAKTSGREALFSLRAVIGVN